jgi:hypothetical protein
MVSAERPKAFEQSRIAGYQAEKQKIDASGNQELNKWLQNLLKTPPKGN